jgi:hypothetical protein
MLVGRRKRSTPVNAVVEGVRSNKMRLMIRSNYGTVTKEICSLEALSNVRKLNKLPVRLDSVQKSHSNEIKLSAEPT